MIRYLLVGVWVCTVMAAASYGAVTWNGSRNKHGAGETKIRLAQIKPKMISVPIITQGQVMGYLAVQLVFHVDAVALNAMSMKPEDALLDATFTTLYGQTGIDFRNLQKQDLPGIGKMIAESVNKRFGSGFVDSVMFHELNYIPRDEVRGQKR